MPALLIGNNYTLIVAGLVNDINYKQRIINAAQKLNVEDRVIFAGTISESEKYWYYKNCLAFVFPSLAEGFGLPVIEAMHFGKPVILSKATALPEVGGEHAYYFDNFDEDCMNAKLAFALKDYSENNRAAAISNWSKKFDWKITAQQHWQLYEAILGLDSFNP